MAKKTTKKQQRQTTQDTASLAKATNLNLDTTLSALSSTGIKVQSSLGKIQEELITKFDELRAVEESIKLKKQELETLHGVDSVLLNLDDANAKFQQELEHIDRQKQEVKQQYADFVAEFNRNRTRDEEHYQYETSQKRKKDNDTWQETLRLRQAEERDRQEKFEKDFSTREATLKAKEVEYQEALTKAATFEDTLKKGIEKETAILKNVLTKDFNHEKQLYTVTQQSLSDRMAAEMASLRSSLEQERKENDNLRTRLTAAMEAQTQLAKDAVTAASNKQAQADALAMITNIGSNGGSRVGKS